MKEKHEQLTVVVVGIAAATVVGLAVLYSGPTPSPPPSPKGLTFGIVSDLHFGTSRAKIYPNNVKEEYLRNKVTPWVNNNADMLVDLGDRIDRTTGWSTFNHVNNVLSGIKKPIYFVTGNHEGDVRRNLPVSDIHEPSGLPNQKFPVSDGNYWYSFDMEGYHFIVLNTCQSTWSGGFPNDFGPLSDKQVNWLKNDLSNSDKPTVVLVHVPLDPEVWDKDVNSRISNYHSLDGSEHYRQILREDGDVIAVFEAHTHWLHHFWWEGKDKGQEYRESQVAYIQTPMTGGFVDSYAPSYTQVTLNPSQKTISVKTVPLGSHAVKTKEWIINYETG